MSMDYGVMELAMMVKEVARPHMKRVYRNIAMNDRVQVYYWRMAYVAVRNKELPTAIVDSVQQGLSRRISTYFQTQIFFMLQIQIMPLCSTVTDKCQRQ